MTKKMRFRLVHNGDTLPVWRRNNWACCDCGLVHVFKFFWGKRGLRVKVTRNELRTKESRRRRKFKK